MPKIHNQQDRMTIEEVTKGLADAKHTFEAKSRKVLQEFNRTERALLQELYKELGYKHGDWVVYDGKKYRMSGYRTVGNELRIKLIRTVGSGLLRKTYEISVKDYENIKPHAK